VKKTRRIKKLERVCDSIKSERALEHDPEKHALVLDTWVDTGFPKKIMLSQ
jgi:hypothetical protein